MIKKVLMISDNDITSDVSLGVTKKLLGQYKAFNNLGYDTYHLCFKDEQGVLIHKEETKVLVKKHKKLFFTYIKLLKLAHEVCLENEIDLCYIRYPLADFAFMGMLKKLNKICKVAIEIPTYPYDEQNKELTDIFSRFKVLSDKYYRNKIKKYNVYFVSLDDTKTIFGVDCINIYNGIDVNSIEYIGDSIQYSDDIHLISVARVQHDHGYDRLIEGLNNYYKNKTDNMPNVYYNVVGNGKECENLKELVNNYNLNEYVVFHGLKFGKELDKMFCENSIAISGLGGHRSGLKKTTILKTREYCARGIPFIGSLPDMAFLEDYDFFKIVESSENPIDINEIVEYYEYIKHHPELSKQMRKFAEENLTWEKQLKKVVDAF